MSISPQPSDTIHQAHRDSWRADVKCFNCKYEVSVLLRLSDGTSHISAESAARTAGWRLWPVADDPHRMLCPRCAGTASDEQVQKIAGWDAECSTCGAVMSEEMEDDDEEGPFTEKDAKDWRSDHECDPDVIVIPPKAAS